MKKIILLFIADAFFLCNTAKLHAQVTREDSLALVDLYNSTNGKAWKNNTGWLTAAPANTWFGIEVVNNRVKSIVLPKNHMVGKIPFSISKLVRLNTLDLHINGLADSIPSSIGKLVNLQTLDLTHNLITGDIPHSLTNLTKLITLSLAENRFNSKIPSFIGNLITLKSLDLSSNAWKGVFPSEVTNLTNLVTLNIYFTTLRGVIPADIGNLVNLKHLDFSRNKLHGGIPASIGDLHVLQFLRLSSNGDLGDTIPASMGNLVNLTKLDLGGDGLTGSLPASLSNLSKVAFMNFDENALTGSIPQGFSNLTSLTNLSVGFNDLSGEIPLSVGGLQSFDAEKNAFTFDNLEQIVSVYPSFTAYGSQAFIPVIQNGNQLSVNAGGTLSNNTYNWYKNGKLIRTKVGDSTFTPTVSGLYSVNVTNSIAVYLVLPSLTVNITIPGIEVKPVAVQASFSIYPNPAHSTINADIDMQNENATLQITDGAGKIIAEKQIAEGFGKNTFHFDISKLAAGNYLLVEKTKKEIRTKQFIKR